MVDYKQNLNIKSLSEDERPREKLLLHGRRFLSDAELVAILIGSGNKLENAVKLSNRILAAYGNNLSELAGISVTDLCKFSGVGKVKALSIVAALELGRRRKEDRLLKKRKIRSSQDAFEEMRPALADLNHEEFWILMLNAANVVKNKVMISRGGRSGTVADPKIIFKTAMDHEAAYIILAHNHPSGNLEASDEDVRITKKLINGGKLLELHVLDHLIIAGDSYYSLADGGHLDEE